MTEQGGAQKALEALQEQLSRSGASWQAADNPIMRMSASEIKAMLGAEPPPGAATFEERESDAATRQMQEGVQAAPGAPVSWDWRDKDGASWVGDVHNQGNCGACVAFGTIAAVEGTLRVKRSTPTLAVDLSEAQLFYCHGGDEGRNCGNGWWPDRALDAFKTKGLVDETCFPYTAGDQPCTLCTDWRGRLTKITRWGSIRSASEMKNVIAAEGPLVGCFMVYDDFPSYSSGVYRRVSNTRLGGHCVCIVGYDDAASCWVAKNSWGQAWGEGGFFRIGYGEAGIDYEMWSVDVPTGDQDSAVWLKGKTITGLWITEPGRHAAAYPKFVTTRNKVFLKQ